MFRALIQIPNQKEIVHPSISVNTQIVLHFEFNTFSLVLIFFLFRCELHFFLKKFSSVQSSQQRSFSTVRGHLYFCLSLSVMQVQNLVRPNPWSGSLMQQQSMCLPLAENQSFSQKSTVFSEINHFKIQPVQFRF